MHNIRIKTERLLLRPLMEEDADSIFEWVSDERVARYMVYTTYTDIGQVREWLAFISHNASTYNFGFERLSDGLLIGSGDIGQGKKPGCWGFGYNFRYDCWGKGYATEAVKAIMGNKKLNEIYKLIRKARYIQSVNIYRVMGKSSGKEYKEIYLWSLII